ncbi:hypothetical protein GCM10010329_27550 [Streptomyces spiroverticillatus]|uniref:7-cyano-7-deazaguanine synthase n=1 Tax=Streptomyces finlayi TaxID=67296 RepID=A0A918WVE9_9ACTN|nr:7-cyano-7-deazaguanine synthase [Streptomyces finlayi]GHA03650.1 hypothetical protein GCM10010329_27550 [Streptomyces spiroverticillatus]GHC87789.1 hypothetical protein GCM10010334_19960 [Streptomyces finlayi]
MTQVPAPNHFWWRAYDSERPSGLQWHSIGETAFQERESRIEGKEWLFRPPPLWADDLLRIARAAFLTDKLVNRTPTEDRWTRRLRLSVPVSDPDLWADAAARLIPALLQTLTGDHWEITLRAARPSHRTDPLWDYEQSRAHEAALFSGGLDSLSWAAQRASVGDNGRLLLVTFIEKNLESVQSSAYDAVHTLARESGRHLHPVPLGQTPGGSDGSTVEQSSRPRGLLYAAAAIRAAAANGVTTVQIPENGQLALNPPLTSARSSALSTRSVHPRTLHLLNTLIRSVDGTVTAENPLARLTKGDICRAALDSGLPRTALENTLSCGASPLRLNGRPYINCGTCFPCLIRRSGLLSAAGVDDTSYETAPWLPGTSAKRTEHWRAVQQWLARSYSALDVIGDVPLPPGTHTHEWLDVIKRGRGELQELVRWALEVSEVA